MADFSNFAELIAKYQTALPTLSDGEATSLQTDVNGRLLVQADVSVQLDHTDGDSVQIGDGTDLLAVNADGSINVVATATDLDIRDLSSATDSVSAVQSGTWSVDAAQSGAWTVAATQSGAWTVTATATDLDIRDLSASQDNVAISDGTDTLAVNADGSINISAQGGSLAVTQSGSWTVDVGNFPASQTVDATDLDIRDLSHTQDSVQIGDGTDLLAVNADGSINVVVASSVAGAEADFASDPTGDGLVAIADGNATILAQQAVAVGDTYKIYAWNWVSDLQGTFKLEIRDDGVLVEVIRVALNSGSSPTGEMSFPKPIEIAGALDREVRVYFTRAQNKTGSAAAGVNGELIS